ncbi:MAG: TIGR02444 family protein [Asticcacaulis sp.]|uniref:TIGR02444 family protein n=1 Tax=Asticcacaulis sp. TaxID=1872648 RepID=UPI0039E6761D
MTESTDIWPWVIDVYAAPGVAEQCLNLQDEHDQNVPLLLWAAWAATHGAVDQALAARAADMARTWSDAVIVPLRGVRRRLKAPLSDGDATMRLALREQVKVVELQSEKVLLEQLAALSVRSGAIPDSLLPVVILDALLAVASVWSQDFPAEKLARLTQALSEGLVLRYNS